MADWTPPTAADIKTRFPEFAAVDDALITAVIGEAGRFVDGTWIEGDRTPATQYWVAHTLQMQGLGTSTTAKLAAIGDFSRIKSGDLDVTRSGAAAGAGGPNAETYDRTTYGQQFKELRARGFPGLGIF